MSANRRARLEQTLQNLWLQRSATTALLSPISLLYGALRRMRRALFQWGVLRSKRVKACVIVVGNVVVGGGGKTPTVIAIAQYLQAKGYRVGIVSRGFGRSTGRCMEVHPDALPALVGDEPAFIQRATQLPVFVGRNRHQTAQALLAQYPKTDVIICDDGLQHYGLYRDLEVCVFDARGCGNHLLLPAGPLREPWPREDLQAAGQAANRLLVLHTHPHPTFPGYTAQRSLHTEARRANGELANLQNLRTEETRPLVAMAAIAQPEPFFTMLREQGLILSQTIARPDHDSFAHFDAAAYADCQLLCTEKDALKLWAQVPQALAVPLIQTIEPAFFQHLGRGVETVLARQLSSPYGYQTS